jgi:hypothetical protein
MIKANDIVQFVTRAPSPALRTGFVVEVGDVFATVGVTHTRVFGKEEQSHNIPRTFSVPVSELTQVDS